MNKKATDIVSYITPIGWVVAYLAGDRYASRYHLNQALVICLMQLVYGVVNKFFGRLWIIGSVIGLIGVALFIVWAVGLYSAITEREIHIPFVSDLNIL